MFRFAVVASFFLIVMMFANVVLLYLDRQREVVTVVAAFFLTNLILTLVTIRLGYQHYGLGFATACLVGMLLSLFHVANQLHNLVYVTFATTPVLGSRPPRRTLLAAGGPWYGRYVGLGAGKET
jgi:uncharacterized membrane protein